MTHSVILFPLPPSTNELVRKNRTNKYLGANEKAFWERKLQEYIHEAKPHKFDSRFLCIIEFFFENPARDPDNLNGTEKMIFDALKASKIIVDDSSHWVGSVFPHFYTPNHPQDLVRLHIFDDFDEFLSINIQLTTLHQTYWERSKLEDSVPKPNKALSINGISIE